MTAEGMRGSLENVIDVVHIATRHSAMSRSRRKTPKTGITSSASEKIDKQFASRRARRWLAAHLNPEAAAEPGALIPLPGPSPMLRTGEGGS